MSEEKNIVNTEDPDVRYKAQILKKNFLEKAGPLVDEYVDAALGIGEGFQSTNSDARAEVWELLKKLILTSSDRLTIDVKKAEDVLKAVSEGRCTFEEGQELLKIFKTVKEINTMGMNNGLPGGTNFTIQIQGAEPQSKVIEHED